MKFEEMKLVIIFEFIIACISIIILFLHLTTLTETVNKLVTFRDNDINIKYNLTDYI